MAKKVTLVIDEVTNSQGETLNIDNSLADLQSHTHTDSHPLKPTEVTGENEFLTWDGAQFGKAQVAESFAPMTTGEIADGSILVYDSSVGGFTNQTGPSSFESSGGDETHDFTDGSGVNWRVHTFLSTGTLECKGFKELEFLVVGGGGYGCIGETGASGGGGGAVLQGSFIFQSVMTRQVSAWVGAGGGSQYSSGTDSRLYNGHQLIAQALGGGSGIGYNQFNGVGKSGGSGGGAVSIAPKEDNSDLAQGISGGGASVGGNRGGHSIRWTIVNGRGTGGVGAGGGGAGTAGGDIVWDSTLNHPRNVGNGGDGLEINFDGTPYWFGGGGGGGSLSHISSFPDGGCDGGKGGGGCGSVYGKKGGVVYQGYKNMPTKDGTDGAASGAANSGGGGGAGGAYVWATVGKAINWGRNVKGGSGIVMIRYKI